jgi:hypothetical protein
MSTKMRMPCLVSTMSTHQHEELNMVERSTCNCFHPTWKPTSRAMVAKVSQTTSWVPMHSLPWAQHKRWIPIGSMGCVHTHREIPTISGWGNPSRIQSIVEKIKETNWKLGKIGQIVSQACTPRLELDKLEHNGIYIYIYIYLCIYLF